jgi:hypothetical protein
MEINSKVKYTEDAKYDECVCIFLMPSICAAPLIFKVLKVNESKNNVGITSAFPCFIPTFVLAPAWVKDNTYTHTLALKHKILFDFYL